MRQSKADKLRQYLIARLNEPSTWRGVVLFLAAVGIDLVPEQTETIVSFGLGMAGLIGVLSEDKV
jgi:hypothetical protein